MRPHHLRSIGSSPCARGVPATGEKSAYSATNFFVSRTACGKILRISGPGEKTIAVAPSSICWRTALPSVNKSNEARGPIKIAEEPDASRASSGPREYVRAGGVRSGGALVWKISIGIGCFADQLGVVLDPERHGLLFPRLARCGKDYGNGNANGLAIGKFGHSASACSCLSANIAVNCKL